MRVAMTGSSGLLGRALVAALQSDGDDVIRLVRRPPRSAAELRWDPQAPGGGLDPAGLDGVGAVVNLAGAGVADHRWTASYRETIRASRVTGTRALAGVLAGMKSPPSVLLSGSAVGWYGDTGGREVDESAPAGTGFLAGVVKEWEAAADQARAAGVRVITLRSGIVLTREGGVLGRLLPLFRLGLGARLGSGRQIMSWVALADWLRIARFLLDQAELSGPVNLTSPEPVSNATFTSELAAALHRPAVLSVPAPVLELAVGGVASDLLSSAAVLPRQLSGAGFEFSFPGLAGALRAELG
jgi:uncharacterized protein (TIGR01777 family)